MKLAILTHFPDSYKIEMVLEAVFADFQNLLKFSGFEKLIHCKDERYFGYFLALFQWE